MHFSFIVKQDIWVSNTMLWGDWALVILPMQLETFPVMRHKPLSRIIPETHNVGDAKDKII